MSRILLALSILCLGVCVSAETIKIGLNYPKTGPYIAQGLDEFQAAEMALQEINAAGGIMGNKIEFAITDSQSNAAISSQNAEKLITEDKVKMIFGGSASSVAVAVGKVANEHKIPFFATLAYANEVTVEEGRKYVFRECYDSDSAANALGDYIKKNLAGKSYFYVTAHYNWGYSTEKSIRHISNTEDIGKHSHAYTPFPGATQEDFKNAIGEAKKANPDVLVLVLFGADMVKGMQEVAAQGLKDKIIIVPNLTLGMAEGAGPEAMAGVIGASPWTAQVPGLYNFPKGKKFVEKFKKKYHRLPDTPGASAYTILYEYKNAVERAKSFDSDAVVKALEGHHYTSLKGDQYWRDFDHQSIQTVYAVKVRPTDAIKKSEFGQDYFEVISSMKGEEAFIKRDEWDNLRKAAHKPLQLE